MSSSQSVESDAETGEFKLTGTMMRLYDKYDMRPPPSASSVSRI